MPTTPVPQYDFGQETLYGIASDMIRSLEDAANLPDFQAYKPTKYTPPYILLLKGKLATAKGLPDDTQRSEAHETDKTELIAMNKVNNHKFQLLKGYIHDGFPRSQWTIKYKAAGMVDNAGAVANNWNSANKRNQKMNDFLADATNVIALTAGHMPAGFPGQVTSDTGDFSDKYSDFVNAMHTGVGTGDKIEANNELVDYLQDIQNDSHLVYWDNATKLDLFMIEKVRLIIAPLGSASATFELIEMGTNLPITIGDITIQSMTGTAMTKPVDAGGPTKFDSIDPYRYRVKIVIPGRPVITAVKEVNTGTNARMTIMVPAV